MSAPIDEAKTRIQRLGQTLGEIFIGRQQVIRLILTATLAKEPILFVGPPGTAKSMIVNAFCRALDLDQKEYFEYNLTRFSEPSELLGPVDIRELREGRYRRRTEGMLPTARVAFLDEVFKANSAILNVLLTIINERVFYQDGDPVKVPLHMIFGASNEIPTAGDLEALKDRFVLKVETKSVREDHFWELLGRGMDFESRGETAIKLETLPTIGVRLEDFEQLHGNLVETTLKRFATAGGDARMGTAETTTLFHTLIQIIEKEEKILMTDRRLIKLAKLVLADAYLHGTSGMVEPENMYILAFAGHNYREMQRLEERIFDRIRAAGGG